MVAASSKPPALSIAVLGMHRSGTSVVSRSLDLLGAYLGEAGDFMPAHASNPEGFWERTDLCHLHDRVLATLGRSWDTVAPLPRGWELRPEIGPHRTELRELVGRVFGGRALWAWKDPRASLLLPLWKGVLEELGVGLRCVLVVRNPLDAARSLLRRDGIPLDKGLGVWLNYNLEALEGLRGCRGALVSYDALLDDWERELRRCAGRLGLPWPEEDDDLRRRMAAFLRPDLRHGISTPEDLAASEAPAPVRELFVILEAMVRNPDLPPPGHAEIRARFADHARLFAADVEELFALRGSFRLAQERAAAATLEAGRLAGEIAGRDATLAGRDALLTQRDRELTTAAARLGELQERLRITAEEHERRERELHGRLEEERERCGERERQLLGERDRTLEILALRERQLGELFSSLSWKWTAPLRRLADALRLRRGAPGGGAR